MCIERLEVSVAPLALEVEQQHIRKLMEFSDAAMEPFNLLVKSHDR